MSQKDLKQDVLNALAKKGILSHLQALYIELTVKEIAKSDIQVLKPYRIIKDDEAHKLAGQIVIQYFAKHGLALSMDSALAESNCQIETGEDAPSVLGIERREIWVKSLLQDWNQSGDKIKENNRKKLLEEIVERLEMLGPKKLTKVAFEESRPQENIPLAKQVSLNSDIEMIRKSQEVPIEHESSSVEITGDLDDVEIEDSHKEEVFPQDESSGDIDVMTGSASDVDDFDAPPPKTEMKAPSVQKEEKPDASDPFDSVNSDDFVSDVDLDQSGTKDHVDEEKPSQFVSDASDDFDNPGATKQGDDPSLDYSGGDIDMISSEDFDSKVVLTSPTKATGPARAPQSGMITDSDDVSLDESDPEPVNTVQPVRQNPVTTVVSTDEDDDISIDLSD